MGPWTAFALLVWVPTVMVAAYLLWPAFMEKANESEYAGTRLHAVVSVVTFAVCAALLGPVVVLRALMGWDSDQD